MKTLHSFEKRLLYLQRIRRNKKASDLSNVTLATFKKSVRQNSKFTIRMEQQFFQKDSEYVPLSLDANMVDAKTAA